MLKVNVIKRYNFKIMICMLQPRPAAVTLTMIPPSSCHYFLTGKNQNKTDSKDRLGEN